MPEPAPGVSDVLQAKPGDRVTIKGWVASKSVVGGLAFLTLRSGAGTIQLTAKRQTLGAERFSRFSQLNVESAISVTGTVREDPRAPFGREVAVEDFYVIADAEPWPVTKSSLRSPSFIWDKRHLTIRGPRSTAIAKIRSTLFKAAFDFFTQRGFVFITAPLLVKNAVEGGATLFEVDYFGDTVFLSQSAQLYEEAAIASLEKVFVIQPAFRAEKSRTPKHLTEFWMIEAEMAFATQEENMALQEELVCYLYNQILKERERELAVLGRKLKPLEPPFPRITYDEAREIAESEGVGFPWGDDLPTQAERAISKRFDRPFFVTGYPLSARSFYHLTSEENPEVTLSADLMAPEGYGEIATGGQRIHDYRLLEERIQKQDLPPESFTWYLELRRYGMPPHAGFGLGVERFLRWVCGVRHIRETTLFPRTPARVTP
jgi:asparaginyl-tRNA synthetase